MLSYDSYLESMAKADATDQYATTPSSQQTVFRVGVRNMYVDIDTQYGVVTAEDGSECAMNERSLQLLAALAQKSGTPISRKDLVEISGSNERNLGRHIGEMRRALGVTATENRENIILSTNQAGEPAQGNRNFGWMALLDKSIPALTQKEMGPWAPNIVALGTAAVFIALDLRDPKHRLAVAEDGTVLPLSPSGGTILHYLAKHPNKDVTTSDLIVKAGLQAHDHRLTSLFNDIRLSLGQTAEGIRRSTIALGQARGEGVRDKSSKILSYRAIVERFVPPDHAWFVQAIRNADRQF